MWTQSLGQSLKLLIAVSVIFAVVSIGLFFLQLRSGTTNVTNQAVITLQSIQKNVTDMKEMTNATLFQIGDVSHEAADMIRMQKEYVTQESKELVKTNQQLNSTLLSLQQTIQHTDGSTQAALEPIPALLQQTQATLAASQRAIEESQKTIATLNQLASSTAPTIEHVNTVTANLGKMSTDLESVVHNATKPQPWYKKVLGYVWAPIKLASLFAK